MSGYRTIVADPPWPMPDSGRTTISGRNGSATWDKCPDRVTRIPYETIPVDEIAALPVSDLAAADAHLYLWTCNRFLEGAYRVAREWGFRPAQLLTWCKRPNGLGFGGAFTSTTEFVLFSRRGSLKTLSRTDSSWWEWKRPYKNGHIDHSAKPDAFLDIVERVSPGPYLELFARRQRLGWDTWGNEALEHVQMGATA